MKTHTRFPQLGPSRRQKAWTALRRLWFLLWQKLHWSSTYHVAYKHTPSGTIGSMTITISPWMCAANYEHVVNFVSQDFKHYPAGQNYAVVTSITKIGGPV